jgi:hypothetical protein
VVGAGTEEGNEQQEGSPCCYSQPEKAELRQRQELADDFYYNMTTGSSLTSGEAQQLAS